MATTTVTKASAPGVTPSFAAPSRSGSAMRIRAESRGHARPSVAASEVDHVIAAFMKMMEEMRAELAATNRQVAALTSELAVSKGRYTELAAATAARDTAVKAQIAAIEKALYGGFAKIDANITKLNSECVKLTAEITSLKAEIKRLDGRCTHLHSAIGTIRDTR